MRLGLRSVVFAALLSASMVASAVPLLNGSFGINTAGGIPIGPFTPNESIEIRATVNNISSDQAITICEGVCIGDEYTYSLGGFASIPNGYSFIFGNGGDTFAGWLNGQIAGTLLPGEEKVFVFGIFSPTSEAQIGFYSFSTQLQIFAATEERPLLSDPTFGGRWEVVADDCEEFPGGGATGGCFPGPGPFPGVPEPSTLGLLGLGLAGLGFARRRRLN